MQTDITNLTDTDKFYGFIPPHGATIAAGDTVRIDGDLRTVLASGRGRYSRRREIAALNAEELADDILVANVTGDSLE